MSRQIFFFSNPWGLRHKEEIFNDSAIQVSDNLEFLRYNIGLSGRSFHEVAAGQRKMQNHWNSVPLYFLHSKNPKEAFYNQARLQHLKGIL